MNGQKLSPVEQAHQDLRNILLNGRILINGMPLTGNELGIIIQGEQMLYDKAVLLDKAEKNPEDKKPNIIPLKQPKKKE